MRSRIQIIGDNVALTTLLAKASNKFGYDPVVKNNPLLAVNTVRHGMPDLILLDVMMPGRDGGRVLADLRNDLSLRYIRNDLSLRYISNGVENSSKISSLSDIVRGSW
jgi:CheY-like chemotaxis protein